MRRCARVCAGVRRCARTPVPICTRRLPASSHQGSPSRCPIKVSPSSQQASHLMGHHASHLMGHQASHLMGRQASHLMGRQASRLMGRQASHLMGRQASHLMGRQASHLMGHPRRPGRRGAPPPWPTARRVPAGPGRFLIHASHSPRRPGRRGAPPPWTEAYGQRTMDTGLWTGKSGFRAGSLTDEDGSRNSPTGFYCSVMTSVYATRSFIRGVRRSCP